MCRHINAERHAAHHKPTTCNADGGNAAGGGEAVSARTARANNPNRREPQHLGLAAEPEWPTTILIWMQSEPRLAPQWDPEIIWGERAARTESLSIA
jgi:hypothetical protein